MIPYFVLLSLPALGALGSARGNIRRQDPVPWVGFGIILVFMIGFRYRVGADWGWIQYFLDKAAGQTVASVLQATDPGYSVLIWLFARSGLNVWIINIFGATIFAYGLIRFCRREPHPWLTATVAVPYLVVVVAMGYDRQSIAIALAMNGLVALQERSLTHFFLWVAAATSFHTSALVLAPIGLIGYRRLALWQRVVLGAIGLRIAIYLVGASTENLASTYMALGLNSRGAGVRLGILVAAGAIFVLWRNRFARSIDEARVWTPMAIGAMLLPLMLLVVPSSTAVDRIGLYFIPVELLVFGRLPSAFGRKSGGYRLLVYGVISYSFVELMVWLNWADTAFTWLPYQFFPWGALLGHSI